MNKSYIEREKDKIQKLAKEYKLKIGRAHVWTPVTLIYLVCRLLLEKKKKKKRRKKKKKDI